MTDHEKVSVTIPADEAGYVGMECPACRRYFKVKLATVTGEQLHCPYCGQSGESAEFRTRAQMEYARSVAAQQVSGKLLKQMKEKLNRDARRSGGSGLTLTMDVKSTPRPIPRFSERQLNTIAVCPHCAAHYAVESASLFCPNCGKKGNGVAQA